MICKNDIDNVRSSSLFVHPSSDPDDERFLVSWRTRSQRAPFIVLATCRSRFATSFLRHLIMLPCGQLACFSIEQYDHLIEM